MCSRDGDFPLLSFSRCSPDGGMFRIFHRLVPMTLSRRQFVSTLSAVSIGAALRAQDAARFPPIRQITRGPGFHWFGYYDKLQFSPDNRFVLSNKVSFEHRSPVAEDVIEVGMVDLQEKEK